jgi:hypothetical protein
MKQPAGDMKSCKSRHAFSLGKYGQIVKKCTFQVRPSFLARLAGLLSRVAKHYPGRRIEIISGQRARKEKGYESYHNKGRAVDFRVQGVSNFQLSQFVRQFNSVGVGYYPNSVFIHMDARDRQAYWIDYSAPGEKAIYGRKGMSKKEIEAIRTARREKAEEAKEAKNSKDALTAKNSESADLPTS